MSTPLIRDATYQIANAEIPGLVADLYAGAKFGSIGGYPAEPGNRIKRWNVKNLGNNWVIIESVSTPGTYASVSSQTRGAGLVGHNNPTIWTVRAAGGNRYQILTEDGQVAWFINGHGYGVAITLDTASLGARAQWSFNLV